MTTVATTPRVGTPELCDRCDQTVAKAKTRSGKTILMDFYPDRIGTFVITGMEGTRCVVSKTARYLAPDDHRPLWTCHWDHCHARTRRRNSG
jgi:hypothetical protein